MSKAILTQVLKIDEPKTPYTGGYSDSEGEELSSSGGTRPRRVSLVGAVDADELRKGISVGVSAKPKVLEPGSGEDEEVDESMLTQEQLGFDLVFIFIKMTLICRAQARVREEAQAALQRRAVFEEDEGSGCQTAAGR